MHPLDFILGFVSTDMGIDLGTANALVCIPGHGDCVVGTFCCCSKTRHKQSPFKQNAVGNVAKAMLERAPSSISVIRPLKNGVIADFDITEAMLKYFITKIINVSGEFDRGY